MKGKILAVLLIFVLILLPPLLMRKTGAAPVIAPDGMERLIILTPHAETVKSETGNAFREYYRKKYGKDIYLDFRAPGGTSDIVRFIADRFKIEFRDVCMKNGIPWTRAVETGFSDPSLERNPKADPDALRARKLFLSSDTGIGVDLMYGGGVFDLARQGARGFAVDAGVNPELLAAIPREFGGEKIYDVHGLYYGLCLSTFGICANTDRLAELSDPAPPRQWKDLALPKYYNNIIIADPSKSGSANKCFEIILQQSMAEAGGPGKGWTDGLNLIKRIAANAAFVTDSAGKVTRDVAFGSAAAGMAIDTYGLTEQGWNELQFRGKAHFLYIAPEGGTAVSPDTVQMLRGAPNKTAARAFIEFMLSDGQKVLCFKKGVPGGPKEYELRRPPVLKELYQEQYRKFRRDPDYNPYQSGASFVYHAEWTGKYYNLLRILIRVLMLDCQDELKAAWKAILDAGGPDAVPEAMAQFNDLPFSYEEAGKASAGLSGAKGAVETVRLKQAWRDRMRTHYRNAERLAKEGR